MAPLKAAGELAEEAAIVDFLSSGRLELGLGAGYRTPEFDAANAKAATLGSVMRSSGPTF